MGSMAVVVPTRNRPDKLERCLSALADAREQVEFDVHVGDSSDPALRPRSEAVCEQFPFVHYHRHDGKNSASARNFCTRIAPADVLVGVDDDVYVEPDAVRRLLAAYHEAEGWRVVAGAVQWAPDVWSHPVVVRWSGWGRPPRAGEEPDFLVTAFFAYPRALALACPWNEGLTYADDRYIGPVWQSKGVKFLFAPDARAHHDVELHPKPLDHQRVRIYVNLFEALLARPSIVRALAYEFLGFALGARIYIRSPRHVFPYLRAWYQGHRELARDWSYLKRLVRKPLPEQPHGAPR